MNNDLIHVNTLPPFKRFCMTIGELPTSYLESMTYYEMLVWLTEYLKNTVIPTINNNGLAVEELQQKYIELKSYVDNYFDNLDVQEEINNKLDDMVEQGTLQEIIVDYLNTRAVFCFDNVSSMKQSVDLVDGSYAETLGYYTKNDGGNALYKIRNKTNDDVVDEKFIIEINSTLIAELNITDEINIVQIGGSTSNSVDNSLVINVSLSKLNYAFIPMGTFNCDTQIVLHTGQKLYGIDKVKSILSYSSNDRFIISEDLPTTRYININNLTITGTNKTGYGIYFERTTKQSDTWHRLSNLIVSYFEYGIYLSKHVNETQISDVVTSYNQIGLTLSQVNDFYIERTVSSVNTKHGIYMTNCTEGRVSDTKCWYNGSDSPNTYVNLYMTSCLAVNLVNICCQESYGNNLRIGYSKNISLINGYLSKPSLDGEDHFQIYLEHLQDSNLQIMCANTLSDGVYINKILSAASTNIRNNIKILVENDFPENKKFVQVSSNNGYGFCLMNNIEINNQLVNANKYYNYIINGDLSYTSDITKFIVAGRDYCSIVNGKLRINNNTESSLSVTFKHPVLPRLGLYVIYVKFKKVSGTGRVVIQYTGYKDVAATTTTDEELYATLCIIKNSTAAVTNLNLSVPAGLTIDVEELGLCEGITCDIQNPLYSKSIITPDA